MPMHDLPPDEEPTPDPTPEWEPDPDPEAAQTQARLTTLRLNLPEEPGIYKYLDDRGRIIYVGKAKNLKKRVNSYFTKNTSHDYKTRLLVRRIQDIQYTVTTNDLEALLLESNLIKEHQPRYNIQLRDGKSYPFICIKHERFPRVFPTRHREADKSLYFGPYPSVGTMNALLRFIRENYRLRTCSLALTPRNIAEGKFRPCLEYQIGKCQAPCVGKQTEEDYAEDIRQIRHILKGNFKAVLDTLKHEMNEAARNLAFEKAHFLKNRIEQIQKHRRKSTVVSEKLHDVEVLTLDTQENLTIVNHFKVHSGMIVKTHIFDVWNRMDEAEEAIFAAAFWRLVSEDPEFGPVVLTNIDVSDPDILERATCQRPTRGDELKLLELSLKNCETALVEKLSVARARFGQERNERLLLQAQKDLRLTKVPYHIEGFDNSHIQGYAQVSSCVVFRDGKPARKDYRVFNVETVAEGRPDDFQAMKEALLKRYRRAVADGKPLPDLIVIDGGKGQLSHAIEALRELGIDRTVPIISIAKRLEEIYYMDDPVPLHIDKKSPTLRLLQRIRDESHATAVAFHRKKRDQRTLKTQLTDIKGVGKATAARLLAELRSVRRVEQATFAELTAIIGETRARAVYDFLHPTQNPEPPDHPAGHHPQE